MFADGDGVSSSGSRSDSNSCDDDDDAVPPSRGFPWSTLFFITWLYLQRERTKKLYTDDWTLGDEEIEGRRTFQLDEKIECERYNLGNFSGLFREMNGSELNLAYLQKHGLQIPLLFKDMSGLGLRVPSSNFSVNDVRTCVGKS